MALVVVERTFDPPLTQGQLEELEARMAPCLDIHGVRWVRSLWSRDRSRMVCEYEAPDAASVRQVQIEARARFDTVWVADPLEGEG